MAKSTPTPTMTDESTAVTWFRSILNRPIKPKFKMTAEDNGITANRPHPIRRKKNPAINDTTMIEAEILRKEDETTISTISPKTGSIPVVVIFISPLISRLMNLFTSPT